MKSDIKISVIIPVYNAEKYIVECLDGVCNQTCTEIEIICVNDGSTDNSRRILLEYAEKDPRIILIDQENGGAGSARNAGLDIAKGEYLSFLDADDLFEPSMLDHAYRLAKETDSDVCVFYADLYDTINDVFIECTWDFRREFFVDRVPFDPKEHPNNVNIFRMFNGWPWDKIYKREFIEREGLKYQEIRNTEDMYFVFMSLAKASRVVTLDENLLHQRVNISTSVSKNREKNWECFYLGLKAMFDELIATNSYECYRVAFCNWVVNFSLWYMYSIKGKTFINIYNTLRKTAFREFGVLSLAEEDFFSEKERQKVEFIMSHTVEEALLEMLNEEKENCRVSKEECRDLNKEVHLLSEKASQYEEEVNKLKVELHYESEQKNRIIKELEYQERIIQKHENSLNEQRKQIEKCRNTIQKLKDSSSMKIGKTVTYIPRMLKKI